MMNFLIDVLQVLNMKMQTPTPYGWFHWLFIGITVVATIVICVCLKHKTRRQVIAIVFGTAIMVAVLEIYKQINFTLVPDGNKINVDYQWYAFPWQFCSMPMYVGLLAGIIRKGKIHDALCAFLATFSVFAGVCVMLYPVSVFVDTIGINIQTMICHGSMIVIGVYLMYTGYVKIELKTIQKAIPVFACGVLIAVIMNEIAFYSGLLKEETFNMFFISRHCAPSLPVYSLVQQLVAYPWELMIYIAGFSTAALLVLLISMCVRRIVVESRKKEKIAYINYKNSIAK